VTLQYTHNLLREDDGTQSPSLSSKHREVQLASTAADPDGRVVEEFVKTMSKLRSALMPRATSLSSIRSTSGGLSDSGARLLQLNKTMPASSNLMATVDGKPGYVSITSVIRRTKTI
jgi:hypothetical protein